MRNSVFILLFVFLILFFVFLFEECSSPARVAHESGDDLILYADSSIDNFELPDIRAIIPEKDSVDVIIMADSIDDEIDKSIRNLK